MQAHRVIKIRARNHTHMVCTTFNAIKTILTKAVSVLCPNPAIKIFQEKQCRICDWILQVEQQRNSLSLH